MADGPSLDRDRVEGEAERILSSVPGWVWDGASLPVPVEQIVDSQYMLLVREIEDMASAPGLAEERASSLSGLLLTALGEIWVNADEARQWPARRRFTIGHELGHWVMHRSGQQSMFCRRPAVGEGDSGDRAGSSGGAGSADVRDRGGDGELPLSEAEANVFAAALLMPREAFLLEHDRLVGDVERLCERFGCSEKATLKRIETLCG